MQTLKADYNADDFGYTTTMGDGKVHNYQELPSLETDRFEKFTFLTED